MKDVNIETKTRRGLPKFDSTGWLSTGILFSMLMFAINLWALIAQWQDPFIPFQIGKILGMAVGLALAIHCGDMIVYYKKHGPLK